MECFCDATTSFENRCENCKIQTPQWITNNIKRSQRCMLTCEEFYNNYGEEIKFGLNFVWPCGCPSEYTEERNRRKKSGYEVYVKVINDRYMNGKPWRLAFTEKLFDFWFGPNGAGEWRKRRISTRTLNNNLLHVVCADCNTFYKTNQTIEFHFDREHEYYIYKTDPHSPDSYICLPHDHSFNIVEMWKDDEVMIFLTQPIDCIRTPNSIDRGYLASAIKEYLTLYLESTPPLGFKPCCCEIDLTADEIMSTTSTEPLPLLPVDEIVRLLEDDSDDEGYVSSDSHSSFF